MNPQNNFHRQSAYLLNKREVKDIDINDRKEKET